MKFIDPPVEQFRRNINGQKVTFVDRYFTGPDEEIVVNELCLGQKNTFFVSCVLCLLLAAPCIYVLFEGQNVMLVSICLAMVLCSCLIYLHFFSIKQEILTVIKSTGVQLTTLYATGRRRTRFIDLRHINDIVINEAISMHKIVYYLAVLLKDDQQLQYASSVLPFFLHSMPRLDTLTEIYQSVHSVLWEERTQIGVCRSTKTIPNN